MSSIKDRIRKLQSLDSPATPAPGTVASATARLSTQASLPTSSVPALSRQFSSSPAPAAPDAARIIRRLDADVDPAALADRVRHIERAQPAALAKPATSHSDALDARRAAFETAPSELRPDAPALRSARAAFEGTAPPTDANLARHSEPLPAPPSALKQRASLFEQTSRPETTTTTPPDAAAPPPALQQRRGMFEASHHGETPQPPPVAKPASQTDTAPAVAHQQKPAAEPVKAELPAGKLSQRAAMFEAGGSHPAATEKGVAKTAAAGGQAAPTPSANRSEDALVQEVRSLSATKDELVSRLVELTGAFKRLEKSREELLERVALLEKKN